MGAMTRLDAVNQCLLAAGEAIVADLDNQSGVDTSIVEYLLDQYTDDYQFRGLANNRFTKTLTIDSETGRITLPVDIISLDLCVYLTNADGETIRVSIKKENNSFFLFNVTDQTLIWSDYVGQDIKAVLIVKVDWDDIDTPGQRAIVSSTARRYQMLTQGDEGMDAYLAQDEMYYHAKGRNRDVDSKRRTIWDSSDYQKRRAVYRGNGNSINPNFRSWRGRMQ